MAKKRKQRKQIRAKQRDRVGRHKPIRVKQRIIKALAKMASREEQGLPYIIRLAFKHYVKKARKRKSAQRRKASSAARAR